MKWNKGFLWEPFKNLHGRTIGLKIFVWRATEFLYFTYYLLLVVWDFRIFTEFLNCHYFLIHQGHCLSWIYKKSSPHWPRWGLLQMSTLGQAQNHLAGLGRPMIIGFEPQPINGIFCPLNGISNRRT